MVPRENKSNTYAKFWRDKQRVLWCFWTWPIAGCMNLHCVLIGSFAWLRLVWLVECFLSFHGAVFFLFAMKRIFHCWVGQVVMSTKWSFETRLTFVVLLSGLRSWPFQFSFKTFLMLIFQPSELGWTLYERIKRHASSHEGFSVWLQSGTSRSAPGVKRLVCFPTTNPLI